MAVDFCWGCSAQYNVAQRVRLVLGGENSVRRLTSLSKGCGRDLGC